MKIPYEFVSFNKEVDPKGFWDQTLLLKTFESDTRFVEIQNEGVYQIVLISAQPNKDYLNELQEYISKLQGVLLIVTGDEEGVLDISKLKHDNMKIWLMTPNPSKTYENVDRFIGCGITPHCLNIKKMSPHFPEKSLDWFFSGQITHTRRFQCVAALRELNNGELIETEGFTKGIEPKEFISKMLSAKIVPCPSGVAIPDSFRFWETLETAGIPIVDAISPRDNSTGYWNMLFGEELPFPVISDWSELPSLIDFYKDAYVEKSNEIFAWWQMYKRDFKNWLLDDFAKISHKEIEIDRLEEITVILPTSPIESHPDTSIIEETIKSIRHHLPNSEIILTFDGIRKEQEYKRDDYNKYIQTMLWKCNFEWENITPIVFKEHKHQVGMMRETLKYIRTNKILYMEHDAPLVTDYSINWKSVCDLVDSSNADMVRFHFEAQIPKVHEYLMIDKEPIEMYGDTYVRTIQWSQRPHVATTEFYERILRDHFSEDAITFVEDKMYGVVLESYKWEQLQGWNKFKLWIYHPEGNIKRSYHTDGRGKEEKYKMKF